MRKFLTRMHQHESGDATSGSAAVEFAMILPVVMALTVGAINYGLMGLQMSTLISAARGGAEYAKSNPTDSSLSSHAAIVSSVTARRRRWYAAAISIIQYKPRVRLLAPAGPIHASAMAPTLG
jgi:Flp pilus assembly protein TadG